MRTSIVFGLLVVASGGWSAGFAKDLSPGETFEELKKLCGEWKGTTAEGGAEKERVIAADTATQELLGEIHCMRHSSLKTRRL